MSDDIPAAVLDPRRLAAVTESDLFGTETEPAYERLVHLAAVLLDAPLAFFTVVDHQVSWYKSAVGLPPDAPLCGPVEASFCKYVIDSRKPLIVADTRTDARTAGNPAIAAMGVAAWAGFPVKSPSGEVLGSFCVVDTESHQWTERDVEVLSVLSAATADEVALHLAHRSESQARKAAEDAVSALGRAQAREHQLLQTIQHSILPGRLPDAPGLVTAVRYQSASVTNHIGGDWYDVVPLLGGRTVLTVADVTGHDAEAVAVMAQLRHSLHVYALDGQRPALVLARLHDLMVDLDLDRFLSIVYGIWDPAGGTYTFLNAGHPPPLLANADGAHLVEGGRTMLLGVPDTKVTDSQVVLHLETDDTLVLYTDGLIEVPGQNIDVGLARLRSLVDRHIAEPEPGDLVDDVMADLRPDAGWYDDVAVVVARRR